MASKILVDFADLVEWLWENHGGQVANAFAFLSVVTVFYLWYNARNRRLEERARRDYERQEQIKKATIKRAEEMAAEERRKAAERRSAASGRRIFKVVSYTQYV